MTSIFALVARRANLGGLPLGEEAVREIDRLLFEERLAIMRRGTAAGIELGVGGENADRRGETHLTGPSSHSGKAAVNR